MAVSVCCSLSGSAGWEVGQHHSWSAEVKQTVETLLLIRMVGSSAGLASLPNEVMFVVFAWVSFVGIADYLVE